MAAHDAVEGGVVPGAGVGVGAGSEPGVPPIGALPAGGSELDPLDAEDVLPLSIGDCGAQADSAVVTARNKKILDIDSI